MVLINRSPPPLWELPQQERGESKRALKGRRERYNDRESCKEKEKGVCQGMQNKMPPESFSLHAYLTVHVAAVPTQDQREGVRSREPCALQAAAVLQSAKRVHHSCWGNVLSSLDVYGISL